MFVFAGFSDFDRSGWLIADLQENIQFCVEEKAAKIARVRGQYARWWLLLVDHIGMGSTSLERELLEQKLRIRHGFERLVVLSPFNHTLAWDIASMGDQG
jgi:hypothetical protein